MRFLCLRIRCLLKQLLHTHKRKIISEFTYMIHCFVINLAHAVERRAHMEEQLQAQGIQAEFLDAVNGRQMSEVERQSHLNDKKMKEIGWKLSPAEIGCALSHLKVYELMVERQLPYAIILEDDIELAGDFAALFQADTFKQIEQGVPAHEPHVVQLSYVRRAYRYGFTDVAGTRYMRVRSYSATWSTAAYIITLPAAKKLLEERYPIWAPADNWNYSAKKLGWFTLHAMRPNPVWESNQSVDSAIGLERSDNPHPRRKGVLGLVNRLYIEGIIKTMFVEPLPRQESHTIIDAKSITSNARKTHKRLI